MRLCEVRGCVSTAVGLVTIKAPSWRVAESRRVCSRHHTELGPQAPQEASVGKDKVCVGCKASGKPIRARGMCGACYQSWRLHKRAEEEEAAAVGLEVEQALRALLAEVDPFQAPLVADLAPLQVVAALRKAHMDTVARWADKAERLEAEVSQAHHQTGDRMVVGAAATVAARAADELEPWSSQKEAAVGMMLRTVVDTLASVAD